MHVTSANNFLLGEILHREVSGSPRRKTRQAWSSDPQVASHQSQNHRRERASFVIGESKFEAAWSNLSWDDNTLRSSLVSRVYINSTLGRGNNDMFRSPPVAKISLNGTSLCRSISVFLKTGLSSICRLTEKERTPAVKVQSAKKPQELRAWNFTFVELVSEEQWIFWVDEICDVGISSIYCFRSDLH